MKAKIMKVLRFIGIDVLLMELVEKIALGLVKKLTRLADFASGYLTRAQQSSDCSFEQ